MASRLIEISLPKNKQEALEEFAATRGREGEKLKEMILERATQMEALVAEAAPHLPRLRAAYQEKLLARFREAAASLDEDRIRQELHLSPYQAILPMKE